MAGKGNKEKRPQPNKKITSSTNVSPSRHMFKALLPAIGSCSRKPTPEATKSISWQPPPPIVAVKSSSKQPSTLAVAAKSSTRQPTLNRQTTLPVSSNPSLTTPSPAFINANGPEDDISVDGPPTKKRVRGLTTNKLVAKLIPSERIDIELGSEMRALGRNSSKFANFLGPLVRCSKFVPVQVDSWSAVDENVKEWLFKRVCDYFNFEESTDLEQVRWAVYQTSSNAFRNHRHDIKEKYYDIYETNEERLAAEPPHGMSKEDWEFLVRKFGSHDFKLISERNSSSRNEAIVKHTSGSVSHTKVLQLETAKNGGVPPTEFELYTKVHAHKADGTPADKETSQVEEITLSEGEDSTSSVNIDEIFHRVRGQIKKRNVRPRIDRSIELARFKELEERLAYLTAKREEAERRVEESRLEDIRRHEEMERWYVEMERKLEEFERDKTSRELMERRLIELTSQTSNHEEMERWCLEMERKLEELERDKISREAMMKKKLADCLKQINSFRETFQSQGLGPLIPPCQSLRGKGQNDEDDETCDGYKIDDNNVKEAIMERDESMWK